MNFRTLKSKNGSSRPISPYFFFVLLIVSLSFVLSRSWQSRRPLQRQKLSSEDPLPVLPDPVKRKSTRTLLFQHYGAYFSEDHDFKSYEQAIASFKVNSGNFIWRYAGRMIIDDVAMDYCAGSFKTCTEMYPESTHVVAYQPAANLLIESGAWNAHTGKHLLDIKRLMMSYGTPYMLLGAGAQGLFSRNKSQMDFRAADGIQLHVDDYNLIPQGVELLTAMQQQKQVVFFRGSFTESVAKRNGYHLGVATGCPSLMLNRKARLGAHLQAKYDALKARIGDTSLKIAMTYRPNEKYGLFLLRIFKRYPNSVMFAQGKRDLEMMRAAGVPFNRVRFFPANAQQWIDSLQGFDLCIGARIHGNMAALASANPVPVMILAPDYRVLELADAMQLPWTTWYDSRLSGDMDVAKFVTEIGFDGEQFDKNRCRIARTYIEKFEAVGVVLAAHIYEVARIC